jgi:hypothetical protein
VPLFGLDTEADDFSYIEEELCATFTLPDPYLLGIIAVICISMF